MFTLKTKLHVKNITISKVMIPLVFFYCILFPADKLNIKEIILLLTLLTCYMGRDKIEISMDDFWYGIVWPVLLIIYALIRGVALGSALSYGYEWVFVLLLPEIHRKKIDVKTPYIVATYIVALVIDFIMLCDIFGVVSIFSNPVANFFIYMNEISQVGKGELATFGYSIFYKSCPLILITHGYFVYKKRYLLCIPLMLSLLGCGTRANFLMSLFISVAVPILCTKKQSRKMIIILIIVAVGLYLVPTIIDKMVALNALKYDRSEKLKIADMQVIIKLLKSNIFNLLFGTGVGSSFLSPRGEEMTTFELSYVDLLRQSGITGICVFSSFVIKPVRKMWIEHRWLLICFIAYLAVAVTNPLLVTSTSFMLYVLVYSEIQNKENIGE